MRNVNHPMLRKIYLATHETDVKVTASFLLGEFLLAPSASHSLSQQNNFIWSTQQSVSWIMFHRFPEVMVLCFFFLNVCWYSSGWHRPSRVSWKLQRQVMLRRKWLLGTSDPRLTGLGLKRNINLATNAKKKDLSLGSQIILINHTQIREKISWKD